MPALKPDRRRLAPASAVAILTAFVAVTGSAHAAQPRHIGGVNTGLPPSTVGPDLRSVAVDPTNNLGDALGERARFCFDSPIASVKSGFALQSYDVRRAWGGTGALATDDNKCAVVTFPPGSDLAQATIGEVGANAVADLSGKGNILASEPLAGSVVTPVAGATTAPDLVAVSVDTQDATHKRVTYAFDENLNPNPTRPDGPDPGTAPETAYQAQDFAYALQNGAPVAAAAGNVTAAGNQVTVDFGGAPVENAVRFVTGPAAVEDRPVTNVQAGSGLSLVTPSSPGVVVKNPQTSGRPDLLSAVAAGANAYKLTFSTGVSTSNMNAGLFRAVADDGTLSAVGSSLGTGGSQDSVLVQFPDSEALTKDPGSIVRIFAADGAVANSTDATAKSLAGQAATQTANSRPGFTNGPDLILVGVDPATQRAGFAYDEPVAPSSPAGGFQGFRSDGTSAAGQGTTASSGNGIAVTFGAGIGDLVAFGQNYGTVTDVVGHPNPVQSVSKDLQGGTPPPPPPPPPPPVTTRKKASTRVSLRRRGRRYSGTVSASVKTCRYNRTVVLRKKGRGTVRYGTAHSLSNGKFAITPRQRQHGSMYVFVLAKSTKAYACSKATSRSVR